MKDIVIFDLDDTLVNTQVLARQAHAELEEKYRGQDIGPELYDEEFLARLAALEKEKLQAARGAKELLQWLQANDIDVAVASDSHMDHILHYLRATGLYEYFGSNIYSSEMTGNPKPAPDVIHLASSGAARVFVIGDSTKDSGAGAAADAYTIGFTGVTDGDSTVKEKLLESGASVVVSSMEDVGRHLAHQLHINSPEPRIQASSMFFGKQGAGVLIMAQDTGRVLALKRSDNVQQPRTWGVPGGRMEEGETPYEAAMREVQEEVRYQGNITESFPLKTFETADGGFRFNNWLVVVSEEFTPKLDHETENFQWVLPDEWPEPRHFGMRTILEELESRNVIEEIAKTSVNADAARARAGKRHPPVLYHLIHGEIRGNKIMPSQANPQDSCPYVYATSNLREALPYMTPNGTRLCNAPVPGSEDFLTIIPDRESFMRNGKMQGTMLRISGEGFMQKVIEGEPSTQWVSENPVPIQRDEAFGELRGIEDAMFFGLQVLFTKEPVTEENYDEIQQMIYAPDFPHNLPRLVREGVLIHENSNPAYADKGIKPSLFFQAAGSARSPVPGNPAPQ